MYDEPAGDHDPAAFAVTGTNLQPVALAVVPERMPLAENGLLLEILTDPGRHGLSGVFREALQEIAERLRFLDQRMAAYDLRIERVFKEDERCRRLVKIEGVGPLVATAVVAAVGNAAEFKSGRELSAWLGPGPTAVLERQSPPATRYQQARRSLFAHHPDSWSARCLTPSRSQNRSAQQVGQPDQTNPRHQQGGGRTRQQERAIIWALLTRGDDYRPPAIAVASAGADRISLTQVQA